ncbi:MAG: VOC family protein [Myxococcales bacterium]|nr:VOC family protein [Myxococcales bacterium]
MSAPETGRFMWYELITTDVKKAVDFYTHVTGWKSDVWHTPAGDIHMFASAQGPVASLRSSTGEKGPHGDVWWSASVTVADVDGTATKAKELGGEIVQAPYDMPSIGRLAVIRDPLGTQMGLVAPAQPMPPHDLSKPGEVMWHELLCSDQDKGFAFYSALFGWKKRNEIPIGMATPYLVYGSESSDFGGMFTTKDGKSAWFYYVQVDDLDAALERAKSKEAKLLNGPMEVPGGARIAQLADPQGGLFALLAANRA